MTVHYIGPSKSAGWHLDGGVLRQHCVCGELVHPAAALNGCPRTCGACLNTGVRYIRRDDQNEPVSCHCPLKVSL